MNNKNTYKDSMEDSFENAFEGIESAFETMEETLENTLGNVENIIEDTLGNIFGHKSRKRTGFKDSAKEEENKMVLDMLKEGKISVEEAEKLLKAINKK